MSCHDFLTQVANDVEQAIEKFVPAQSDKIEAPLYEAMRYSLLAGGKRLRPALFIAVLKMFGRRREDFMSVAVALEMIHTYSLIHDDLPAMDDDDLRRGKPTCHIVYGEAMAILAGDALLTMAFDLLSRPINDVDSAAQLAAVREVSLQAGLGGMVAGQAAEFACLGQDTDIEKLEYIYSGKTSALLAASVLSAACLCGADSQQMTALRDYAYYAGLAFQIIDDVLDMEGDEEQLGKPVGSDSEKGLQTYASLVGCDAARNIAQTYVAKACAALSVFGEDAKRLLELTDMLVNRNY